MSTLLLVPLDDTVVFPNMNVTISADVGEEARVLLVPRHEGEYAKVGTVAEVVERARLDRMLKHLYVEIDATDAQKQLLSPIVKGAARDLWPVRAKMHDARRQAVELLSHDTVDRAALEALRADQLKLAEQASRRFTQALADVADVRTPEQRKALAERIGRWHGHRG